MKQHSKILIGLIVGLAAGLAVNMWIGEHSASDPALHFVIANITDPVGQVFLRLLFLIVVPLVLSSLSLGVANLGDIRRLGKIGIRTLAYFVGLTAVAVVVGLVLMNVFQPGRGFDPGMQENLMRTYSASSTQVIDKSRDLAITTMTFVDMVIPRNMLKAFVDMQMLPVILVSLLFGVVLTRMPAASGDSLKRGLTGIYEFSVRVVEWAMRLAPYAVPCLVFAIAARFGLSILKPLSFYVGMVFAGYVIHLVGVYSILLKTAAGVNPWRFFQALKPVMITAFSTSSSNATLPTTIRVTQNQLGVSANISGFVLPMGATINMNGTALYEGMTVLFIAEIFGIELSLIQQALIVVMAVMTAIGTAGVPGGSLPLIVIVMQTVGVPAEGIGIILGVDRILDMGRTVLNVTGDAATAVCVAKAEGETIIISRGD